MKYKAEHRLADLLFGIEGRARPRRFGGLVGNGDAPSLLPLHFVAALGRHDKMTPCGVLNLDKPAGITSRQAVDVLKRLARPAKSGHAGTLDPLATGVLIACVGSATRLIEYVQRMPKAYRATFLGRTSPTEDLEGEVAELHDPPHPTPEEIVTAAARFVGRIA